MGWEQRGSHQYFYRKQRDGLRVKSIYVGRGEIAKMVSGHQSTSGLFERALRIAYPSKQQKLKEQDAAVEHVYRLVDSITTASVLAAGFHLHRRQWRKKRYEHNRQKSDDTRRCNSEDPS